MIGQKIGNDRPLLIEMLQQGGAETMMITIDLWLLVIIALATLFFGVLLGTWLARSISHAGS